MMQYTTGEAISVGDKVVMGDGLEGVVVCDLDAGVGSAKYPLEDWAYLGQGILVLTEAAGIVHYLNKHQSAARRPAGGDGRRWRAG